MSGRQWLRYEERVAIGELVHLARKLRTPWKILERQFGRCRDQLCEYVKLAPLEIRQLGGECDNSAIVIDLGDMDACGFILLEELPPDDDRPDPSG